jgi:hypothetical protein
MLFAVPFKIHIKKAWENLQMELLICSDTNLIQKFLEIEVEDSYSYQKINFNSCLLDYDWLCLVVHICASNSFHLQITKQKADLNRRKYETSNDGAFKKYLTQARNSLPVKMKPSLQQIYMTAKLRYISLPHWSDQLSGPPNLLSNGYQG